MSEQPSTTGPTPIVGLSRWGIFVLFIQGSNVAQMADDPVWSWEPSWVPEALGWFGIAYLLAALVTGGRTLIGAPKDR